jgi:hypothetical protein
MAKKGGKGSRARSKERRAREKRSRKDAQRAQYQRWADEGRNQKHGRAHKKAKKKQGGRTRTPNEGNVGCLVSFPNLNMPGLVRNKLMQLAGYDHQWSSRYNQQVSEHIRANWNSLEEAWAAHGITPVRSDIPVSYNRDNWRTA